MAKQLCEIRATWKGERFRFSNPDGDVLIGEAELHEDGGQLTPITIKVVEDRGDEQTHPSRHRTYRFYGKYQNYENRNTGDVERQFHASTFIACQPHGRAGIIAYLSKAPGIGRVIAGRLFDKFGSDAVRILRTQSDVAAAAVDRLSENNAAIAASFLERDKRLEECTIELIELLDGRKFPKTVVKKAISEWGNRAAEFIKRNPYSLWQFRGVGFLLCDRLYLDLGYPVDALKRQALCAYHAISSNRNGDTWHYVTAVKNALERSIGGTSAKPDKALRLAVRGKILATMHTAGVDGPIAWDGETVWVAEQSKADQERDLANDVSEMMRSDGLSDLGVSMSQIDGLTTHQQNILNAATGRGRIWFLQGSPGVGKSYTTARLIKHVSRRIPLDSIAVAAPTGRAAVRISELMSKSGLSLGARTIHSMLGVQTVSGRDGWSFSHGYDNPLPYKMIVVDEASMIDCGLMYSLMSAVAYDSVALFVGDVCQLPPVGYGAPVRDIIRAGASCGELTEILRNSGGIVEACSHIRHGRSFDYKDNLHLISRSTEQHQIDAMVSTIDAVSRKLSLDPVWDFQVIVAVNKNSGLGRKQLNQVLQNHLNTNPVVPGCPFRLADKVVNTKNGWLPTSPKFDALSDAEKRGATVNIHGQTYVANGDFGKVIRVDKKAIEVVLQAPLRIVIVPRGEGDDDASEGDDENESSTGTGCNWELGYAVSCHKSQGGEWPIAIVMLDGSNAASRVGSREWLLTAFSRAKRHCFAIGQQSTGERFVRKTAIDSRKTFLTELIKQELQEL